jgi:hypothetical protein
MMIQVQRTVEEQIEILMGLLLDLQKQMAQDRQRATKFIEERVDKCFESKLPVIEGHLALRDIVKLRQLLVEKGIIREEEFIAKIKE